MSAVHASQGPLEPASPHLRSEVDIVCSLAEATLGDRHGLPWADFRSDYGRDPPAHRAGRARAATAYDEKVDRPGGFMLPHPPRDSRTFPTEKDRAIFTVSPTSVLRGAGGPPAAADDPLARPVQHHDLRPRGPLPRDLGRSPGGVRAPRRHRGVRARGRVDWSTSSACDEDGHRPGRRRTFRVVAYDQPRGCAAAYYPETNPLVPLDSHRRGQQPAGVQVGRGPARGGRRRAAGRASGERRRHGDARGSRRREQAARRARPAQLTLPGRPGLRDSGGVTNPERDPDEIVCATGAAAGRGDGAAGGAAGRAAGDARTPHAPAAAPVADRGVVLPRPLRPGRGRRHAAACPSPRTRTPGCRP